MSAQPAPIWRQLLHPAVLVGALGYFVDIYDLVLFSIVRVASLRSLGVAEGQLLEVGVDLLNLQMLGMMLGGVFWGVLGDKRGRIAVLFGSILVYSLANIANAFVQGTSLYGLCRLIAGFGLAGELGAAVTLVSESLPRETRGFGTSVVAGIGVSGAMLAALVGRLASWQTAFIAGGLLGLALLGVRLRMLEPGMFRSAQASGVRRGDLGYMLRSGVRLRKYILCILIGLATWFVIGILVTFSPEICAALGATGAVEAGTAILFAYMGLVVGDLASGMLSQWCRSRRRVMAGFLVATLAMTVVFLLARGQTPEFYYGLCLGLGIASGYWALFVTIAAEQFGTNLRSTVAITVPNVVRAAVIPFTYAFKLLREPYGTVTSVLIVGVVCVAIALLALWRLPETFGRDLDFVE